MADPNPTVRQRELGLRLRTLRNERKMTVEDVAEKLLCSPTKISRGETGARRPTLRDVRDLCQVYEVDQKTTDELMELARQAREPAWWTEYDDLKVHFPFIGLEQDATAITCFSMYFLPAFVQTADYARAIIKGIVPGIDPDVLDQRVAARLRRQELLYRSKPPLRYRALLDEAVLHRQVGGAAVMKAQIERVIELAEENRITVQVLPFAVGAYATSDSNFDYLEFGDSALPDLVYVEGLGRESYFDRPAELNRYRASLERLRDTALSPSESIKKIQQIADQSGTDY
jgi:transcriptional regulator with XRE-family HTH domain